MDINYSKYFSTFISIIIMAVIPIAERTGKKIISCALFVKFII